MRLIELLKDWHVLHTWSEWEFQNSTYASYLWTAPDHYNHIIEYYKRTCYVCGKPQHKTVTR